MTDVEFTRLLSDSVNAKVLNRESDSINDLITRFERRCVRSTLR